MSRFTILALTLIVLFAAGVQAEAKSKSGSDAATKADFPTISKDQSRPPKPHALTTCDDTCGGPNLTCFLNECMTAFKHSYCALALPFDSSCNCNACMP